MILALYLTVVLLGAGATYAFALREEAVAFSSLVATASWSIAALQGKNIVLYHQDGSSTTVGSASIQYLFLGLALISVMAWFLWYFGQYPPSDGPEDELDADGAPTTEGY